jgi:L,D-transpeptidase YbiS
MPTLPYVLFDSAWNHRYIKTGDQVMLDALASTGRGTIIVLSHTDGNPWPWATDEDERGGAGSHHGGTSARQETSLRLSPL